MKYLTESEKSILGIKLVDFYMDNGFGTKSKKEIDLFLFGLLKDTSTIKSLSIYELSNFLKITDSKVKNLILESGLRYPRNDEKYRIELIRKVTNSILNQATLKVEFDGKNLKFLLDDPIERREFECLVKLEGYFVDTSYNKDLVSVRLIAFIDVISKYETDIKANLIKQLKLDEKFENSLLNETLSSNQKVENFFSSNKEKISIFFNLLSSINLIH